MNSNIYKERNCKLYATIRENGGWDNWKMIQIEERIVKSKREAEKIEQDLVGKLKTNLNSQRSFYTENPKDYCKQYYQEHKLEHDLKTKKYYHDHIDEIKKYKEQWQEENKESISEKRKEKIICECGVEVRKSDLSRQHGTQKHILLMEQKLP